MNNTDEPTTPPPVPDAPPEQLNLKPWDDGVLLKCAENKERGGTFLLVDGDRTIVGVIRDKKYADFICNAAFYLYNAMEEHAKQKEKESAPRIITPQ